MAPQPQDFGSDPPNAHDRVDQFAAHTVTRQAPEAHAHRAANQAPAANREDAAPPVVRTRPVPDATRTRDAHHTSGHGAPYWRRGVFPSMV